MPRTTLNVSELDVSIDAEGVVRLLNVPGESLLVIEGRMLERLLTEVVEFTMRVDGER